MGNWRQWCILTFFVCSETDESLPVIVHNAADYPTAAPVNVDEPSTATESTPITSGGTPTAAGHSSGTRPKEGRHAPETRRRKKPAMHAPFLDQTESAPPAEFELTVDQGDPMVETAAQPQVPAAVEPTAVNKPAVDDEEGV